MLNWLKKLIGYKNTKFERQFTYLPYVIKISIWQKKERECYIPVVFEDGYKKPKGSCKKAIKYIQNEIEYISDYQQYGRDHWPTTVDVFSTMKDDCDGQAIAAWCLLNRSNFPPNEIGMCFARGIDKAHMFAVWHDPKLKNDFWVLDNGYITRTMKKASKLFPFKKGNNMYMPIFGFNLNTTWIYKKGETCKDNNNYQVIFQ